MTSAVETKQGTLEALRKNRGRIKSFGIRKLGLFGSFVRGDQNSDSDVDLLVEFDDGKKTFDNFMHLAFFSRKFSNARSSWLRRMR